MDAHSLWLSLGDFIAGWVGGIAGLLIGHPADTIKVQQQTFGTYMGEAIKTTYKFEGITGFYKGMLGPFLTIGPSNAVFFASYGMSLRYLAPHDSSIKDRVDTRDPNWQIKTFVAGAIAGTAQVIVTCPIERLKTAVQTSVPQAKDTLHTHHVLYKSTFDAMTDIYKLKGIPGLYRGLVPMLYRDVPASAAYMLVYEELLPRDKVQHVWQQLIAGGIAGVCSWVISLPFDVVKSRIQSDDVRKPEYKGMIDCFQKSYKAEGLRVFAKGFWLIVIRAFPVNAAIFSGYELCSQLFQ